MTQSPWVRGSYLEHHVITQFHSWRGRIWFVERNQWRKFKRFIKSIDWRWNDYFCTNYCCSTNGHWRKIRQWKKYPSAQVYWLIGKYFQNTSVVWNVIPNGVWNTILRHFWPRYWLFLTQMLTFWTRLWLLSTFWSQIDPIIEFDKMPPFHSMISIQIWSFLGLLDGKDFLVQ